MRQSGNTLAAAAAGSFALKPGGPGHRRWDATRELGCSGWQRQWWCARKLSRFLDTMAATALASSALALGSLSSSSKPSGVANSASSSGWRGGVTPSQITARLPVLRRSSFLPAKPVVSRFGAEFNPLLLVTPLSKSGKAFNAGRNVVCMASAADSAGENVPEIAKEKADEGEGFLARNPALVTGAVALAGRSRVPGVSSSVVARVSAATGVNGSASDAAERESLRVGTVSRETKETSVEVSINLDGTGICDCDTGIPFLDHMLDQLASHGLFDVRVKAKGDTYIDDHHTNEDIGLAMGTALLKALGDRKGIRRFGDFSAPLDEALIHVVLDLSGRPYLGYSVVIPTDRVGNYDTQLVEHFFQSMVNTSGMTLHIRQLAGQNSHHIIEATFKAFARALRQATEYDVRRLGSIPSSKGVLSRA